MPEYLDFRCCMCPNNHTDEQNPVCPAGGIGNKPETPCRFVKTYINEDGYTVSVASFLLNEDNTIWFVVHIHYPKNMFPGLRKHEQLPLPLRTSFDEAQRDLNSYAKTSGWKEWPGDRIKIKPSKKKGA